MCAPWRVDMLGLALWIGGDQPFIVWSGNLGMRADYEYCRCMSKPLVSIVSAGLASKSAHLGETATAVLGQSYRDFEWLIQSDGTGVSLVEERGELGWLWADDRVKHVSHGLVLGAGGARMAALARAKGEYVWVMDIDDIPEHDALAVLVSALETSGADWAQGVAHDLTPEGIVAYELRCGVEGYVDKGGLWVQWERSGALPVHTVGMLVRRSALVTAGGWWGLPVSEDVGAVIGVSDQGSGVVVGERTLLYRKWAEQTTASSWYKQVQRLCHSAIREAHDGVLGVVGRVGVCSALRAEDLEFVSDFYLGLVNQDTPWAWYLCGQSGVLGLLGPEIRGDRRVKLIDSGPIFSRAMAKNLACAASVEDVLVLCDPFDIVGPGVLSGLVGALGGEVAYTVGTGVDLGSPVRAPRTSRVISPGELSAQWLVDQQWRVLSPWLAVRRGDLWRFGGHGAVSVSEDAYLAAILGARSMGVEVGVGGIVRRVSSVPRATALSGAARSMVRDVDAMMFWRAARAGDQHPIKYQHPIK
jgi:hypothetical protein